MKLLAFAASLREDSYNRRLLDLVVPRLKAMEVEVVSPHFSEYDVPLYNQDVQKSEGVAPGAMLLAEHLETTDGFVIVSPEYNHGVPGVLKNLIDWVSRIRPEQPFWGKPGMIMTASPSLVGGNRAGESLRTPLMTLGAQLYPSIFSLASAHEAFGEDGKLADEKLDGRLTQTLEGFVDFAGRLEG